MVLECWREPISGRRQNARVASSLPAKPPPRAKTARSAAGRSATRRKPLAQDVEVVHGALMKLVVDYEREKTLRCAAEAEVERLREVVSMARNDARKKVRFADGSAPAPAIAVEARAAPAQLVPVALLASAESHARGLQRKIEAYYVELESLESRLETEIRARLEAERALEQRTPRAARDKENLAPAKPSKLASTPSPTRNPESCPVCYGPPEAARKLPCCSAVACGSCLIDMIDDGHLCCGDCFRLTPLAGLHPDTFLATLPRLDRPSPRGVKSTQTVVLAQCPPSSRRLLEFLFLALAASHLLVWLLRRRFGLLAHLASA